MAEIARRRPRHRPAGAELAVAQDDRTGAVVGYVTMQCDAEARIGWIHNLVVAAEARGQGLAAG